MSMPDKITIKKDDEYYHPNNDKKWITWDQVAVLSGEEHINGVCNIHIDITAGDIAKVSIRRYGKNNGNDNPLDFEEWEEYLLADCNFELNAVKAQKCNGICCRR